MKPVGLIRKCDSLGRIVIPSAMREYHDIEQGTKLEVFLTDKGIFLRPQEDEASNVTKLPEKRIAGMRL